MSLPMAILLSSIMLFGSMGENNELLAFKSAGVPLLKIMSPLIVLIGMISIGAFFFSNNVMPFSSLKMRSLIKDIQDTRPELNIKPGVFTSNLKDYSIKVAKKDNETNMLYGMMIYDHSDRKGNRIVHVADSGKMYLSEDKKNMILELYHGAYYEDVEEEGVAFNETKLPFDRHAYEKEKILFSLDGFGLKRNDENLWKDHFQMLNLKQLEFTIDSLSAKLAERENNIPNDLIFNNYYRREIKADSLMYKNDLVYLNTDSLFENMSIEKQVNAVDLAVNFARSVRNYVENSNDDISSRKEWLSRYEIEWHRKLTLSVACIILFFIGAPLGAIIRKGGLGMPVVVSIVFFLLYYVISITGEKIAREGDFSAFSGMWASSFVLFPVGLFLTYKASRDSVILNIDSYFLFIKKLIAKLKKKR